MADQFSIFFRRLESAPGLIRFFRRSKEWIFYTCHGVDANSVARDVYKTTSAVSTKGGLSTVTVSVKLFSSLVPTLLGRNQRIEVWELEPDSSSRWRIRCSASPGNVEGLISDIENGEGEVPPDTNALGGTALMMSTFVTSGGGVGVAYCNVSFRSVGLLEFHDTTEWNDLESVAIQVGARECILEKDGAFQGGIEEVMRRCNVLCTPKPLDFFKGSKEKILEDLSRLTHQEGGEDHTKSTTVAACTSSITAAGKMPLALTALHALLRHLELLRDPTNAHSFSLTIDELQKYMHYDAAASKAMGVFPSPKRFQLAAALGQASSSKKDSDFSLFSILDKTCTAMGSRRLKGWLQHPLVDVDEINRRQRMVCTLCDNKPLVNTLQKGSDMLRGMPDLEKGAQRFLRKSGKANLRFLLSVYRAIIRLKSITEALADVIKDVPEMDGARATEIQYSDQHMIHSAEGIGAFKEKSVTGKQLVRDRVFVPLNKVRGMRE